MTLNIPLSIETYGQKNPDLKNRRQRRAKIIRPDFTSSARTAQAAVAEQTRATLPKAEQQTGISALPSLPQVGTRAPIHGSEAAALAETTLTQAVVLDWLGQQPIAFHRIYVDITGSVTAAVWLSFALSRISSVSPDELHVDADGIYRFALSSTQCEAETGLTDAEQRRARESLAKSKVLKVNSPKRGQRPVGASSLSSYALDLRELTALLLARSKGLAAMVHQSAALATTSDIEVLERRAEARTARRRA